MTVNFTGDYGITGRIWYRPKILSLPVRAAYEAGLTSQGIASDIWESTPFSFLADYFYNIGSWIRALTPNPYIEILAVSISEKRKEVFSLENFKFGFSLGSYSCSCSNNVAEGTRYFKSTAPTIRIQRDVGYRTVNPPLPSIPARQPPLGFTQTMNAVALGVANTVPILRKLRKT